MNNNAKTILVLDSNIILSGLIWGGKPAQILEHVENGQCKLFTSYPLLQEFSRILSYPKITSALKARKLRPRDLVTWLVTQAVLITPKPLHESVIPDDPTDEAVLACATTAQVDFIISGDKKHLLPLNTFRNIPIVTADQYLEVYHEQKQSIPTAGAGPKRLLFPHGDESGTGILRRDDPVRRTRDSGGHSLETGDILDDFTD